jgi:hypothetical protein
MTRLAGAITLTDMAVMLGLILGLCLFIRCTVFSGDRVSRMKWRAQFRMKPGPGFATHLDILFCWSRWAMIVYARHARPDMGHFRRIFSPARNYAVRLGRANLGRKAHASYEAQMGIIAPARTKKTRYLTDLVYMHPGAVVSATTRPDGPGARLQPGRPRRDTERLPDRYRPRVHQPRRRIQDRRRAGRPDR